MLAKAASVPIEKLCRLGLFAVAARALQEAAFGRFQFADASTALLLLATDLGLGIWTTRALARGRASMSAASMSAASIVGTGLGIRTLATVPYLALVAVTALAVGPGETRQTVALLGVAALGGAFVEYCGAIFRGYERLRDEARLNVVRAVLVAVAGLGGLACRRSVVTLAAGVAVGALAAAAWGLVVVRRRYRLPLPFERGTFDRHLARAAIGEALPLWLATLMSLVYFKGDAILLRLFAGDAAVGSYGAAYKIFEATMIVPSVVLAAWFPALVRVDEERDAGRRGRVELRLGAALLGLGLAAGGTVVLGSGLAIRLVFGPAFANAVPVLRVLGLGVPLVFLNYGLTHFLIARHLERANLVFTLGMVVLNIGANLVAIPRLGGMGAALTTVGTELALTGCCVAILVWRAREVSGPPPGLSRRSREEPARARTIRTSE
jgi:O-antigen/teichoic acid export membrane protein